MAPLQSSTSFRHYDVNIDLDILQQRARHWIEFILEESLPVDQPLPDLLANGAILERVGEKVKILYRAKFGEPEETRGGLRKVLSKQHSQSWGSKGHWDAMANVSSFLKVCTEVGLTDVHLCTPQDVVQQKNIRNVYLCVRTLAIRLFHVKVVATEFEPAEKGTMPTIYHTQQPPDSGAGGHVESVVRRIDEGIFQYPSIRARASQHPDLEYEDEYDEECRASGEDYYSDEDANSRPRLYSQDESEREAESQTEQEGEQEADGASPGDGVQLARGSSKSGDSGSESLDHGASGTPQGHVQQHMLPSVEGSAVDSEEGKSSPATKRRSASNRGSRKGSPSIPSLEEGPVVPPHLALSSRDKGVVRVRRRRSSEHGQGGSDSRAIVSRPRARGSRGGRGRPEELSWKRFIQELPTAVVVGGAVVATGLVGTVFALLFHRRREYRVQKGDCLIKIAQKVGRKDWKELYDQNPDIANPNLIRPEEVLQV